MRFGVNRSTQHKGATSVTDYQQPTYPPGPPLEPPVEPPRPWSRRQKIVGLVLLLAAAAGVAAVLATQSSGHPARPSSSRAGHEVTYQVGGDATSADITISTPNGGTSQQQGVDVPLTSKSTGAQGLTFSGVPAGTFVYIAAQNSSPDPDSSAGIGTITCSILIDGVEAVSNMSSGDYAIATCSGVV
jgi:hypothetical protein